MQGIVVGLALSDLKRTNLEKNESGTHVRVCLEVLNLDLYIQT